MSVTKQREVELFCKMSLLPFMLCLGYDFIFIVLSAAHAFLTRNLPDNFSVSYYLFVLVSTMSSVDSVSAYVFHYFLCNSPDSAAGVLLAWDWDMYFVVSLFAKDVCRYFCE